MRKKYEYTTNAECKQLGKESRAILQEAQTILRKKGITFQPRLVGSGSRGLVTKEIGGNKGFDFDYNLELNRLGTCSPETIKKKVQQAIKESVKGTGYKDPEDSTSVLTTKTVDTERKMIVRSFDIAIVCYDDQERQWFIHKDRNNHYTFQLRGENGRIKFVEHAIFETYGEQAGEQRIRETYLKLKNSNNDPNKRSMHIYEEALNRIYQEMTGAVPLIYPWDSPYLHPTSLEEMQEHTMRFLGVPWNSPRNI